MKIPLGSLYQCRRGLLRRGWRQIEISVVSYFRGISGTIGYHLVHGKIKLLRVFNKGKVKAIPLQAWTGPEGSRRLRLPDFKTIGT
jgi:hypothetical protein